MEPVDDIRKTMPSTLLVRGGERVYGVPVDRVRRVVASMSLWPVAGWAPGLVGLGRFGGEPLAVVSLECLVDDRPPQWRGRSTVVVVRSGSGDDLGLAVDEAQDVVSVVQEKAGASPARGTWVGRTSDGRTVYCLDQDFFEKERS